MNEKIKGMIVEAKMLADKEAIKANMLLINSRFAKTPRIFTMSSYEVLSLPPMILGLETHFAEELPDNVAFALTEACTERDLLTAKVAQETTERIVKQIAKYIVNIHGVSAFEYELFTRFIRTQFGVELKEIEDER